jgi:hypothetical protein
MPHSKQIDMGIELFHENPFFISIYKGRSSNRIWKKP